MSWTTIFSGISAFLLAGTLIILYIDKRQSIRPPINYFCSINPFTGLLEIRLNLGRFEQLPYKLRKIVVVNQRNVGVIRYKVLNVTPEKFMNESIWRNNRITNINMIIQPLFVNEKRNNNVVMILWIPCGSRLPKSYKRTLRLYFRSERFPWRTTFSFEIEDAAHNTYA
ncbi:hypothetical protein PT286_04505 [Neisseriaceae bacterium ESL0693]|nr:hypothetical protein [Neisseriaceae bacterium ESL0693]